MDLEAAEVELELQTTTTPAQGLLAPWSTRAAYNMVATAYRLEDIFDTLDPKTNERLHEARQLLHVALEL